MIRKNSSNEKYAPQGSFDAPAFFFSDVDCGTSEAQRCRVAADVHTIMHYDD